MLSVILFLVILNHNFMLNVCSDSASDRTKLCIQNCGQCKAMYGQYFLGHQCAQNCLAYRFQLESGQISLPDCNSPLSMRPYIRKVVDDGDDGQLV